MNNIVFIENDRVVTDSLIVAEVFNKNHKDVLRDIDNQISKLIEAKEEQWGERNFAQTQYIHPQNKQSYRKYLLTEDAFALVTMSYVTVEAMKFKIKFINEFKRMKEELNKLDRPSYMIDDPIKRAEKWIEEQKEKLMLEQQLLEQKPKVTYYDTILQSKDLLNITQIAKDYGLSAQKLNKILHDEKVQYKMADQWLLYQDYAENGYTQSTTQTYQKHDGTTGTKLHTKWTQKGRLFIHELLRKQGIKAIMDLENETNN